jgi:predicted transposase YdaD
MTVARQGVQPASSTVSGVPHMREAKDRSSKWLIEHHSGSILFFGSIRGYSACRAAHSVITVPERLPDGLLDVFFPGETKPHPVLVEISTYPDSRTAEQALDDLLLVFLARRVVPELLTLVLHPKGQLHVTGQTQRPSRLGLTQLEMKWKVVELWTVPAAELLAANDVGLIPWVPLCQFDGPPETLLQQCRQRIDAQAPPQEHSNLLAVTQVFAGLRYNDPKLLALLGGRQAMLESPVLQELMTEREVETRQNDILSFLAERFGSLPEELVAAVKAIQEPARLRELIKWTAQSSDLHAFRSRLSS